jgi:DNA-binding NarL/FixJ family response regulator
MCPPGDDERTRVLLVDRAGFGRDALAGLLEGIPGVALVGVLQYPRDVRPAVERMRPDVLVVDDRLLAETLARNGRRDVQVIAIGVDDDPGFAARAQRSGAVAWVPKDRADADLPALLSAPAPVS